MFGGFVASSLLLVLQATAQGSPTATVIQQGRLEPGAPREFEITAGVDHAWTIG